MVIGEALVRIRDLEPGVFAQIPDAPKIIRLRNLLAHGYDAVDATAIFTFTGQSLSDVATAVEALLP